MALHGTIEVNGHSLGWWSAVRGRQVYGHPDTDHTTNQTHPVYTYACEVTFYRDDKTLKFSIDHFFHEGAVSLAAKILAFAADQKLGELPDGP